MAMRFSFLRTAFRAPVFRGGSGCVRVGLVGGFGWVRGGMGIIAFVSHEHHHTLAPRTGFQGPKRWGKDSCNQSCHGVIVGCNYTVDVNSCIQKDSACLYSSIIMFDYSLIFIITQSRLVGVVDAATLCRSNF